MYSEPEWPSVASASPSSPALQGLAGLVQVAAHKFDGSARCAVLLHRMPLEPNPVLGGQLHQPVLYTD